MVLLVGLERKFSYHWENLKLKFIQLHGSEDEKYIETLKKNDVTVIKSISINNNFLALFWFNICSFFKIISSLLGKLPKENEDVL